MQSPKEFKKECERLGIKERPFYPITSKQLEEFFKEFEIKDKEPKPTLFIGGEGATKAMEESFEKEIEARGIKIKNRC